MTPEEVKEETSSASETTEPSGEATAEVKAEEAQTEEVIAPTDEALVDREPAGEMAVVTDRQARDYELVMVISPEASEEQSEALINSVSQFVTGREGVITDIEKWGRRNLAYPIRHYVEGNYVLAKFRMKPAFGKQLEANLRISRDVLRHLLVKVDS